MIRNAPRRRVLFVVVIALVGLLAAPIDECDDYAFFRTGPATAHAELHRARPFLCQSPAQHPRLRLSRIIIEPRDLDHPASAAAAKSWLDAEAAGARDGQEDRNENENAHVC